MITVGPYVASLAMSLVVLGFAFCLLPFLRRDDVVARTIVLTGTTVLAWRYLYWRVTQTTPELDLSVSAFAGWSFAAIEAMTILSSSIAALIMTRTIDRTQEAERYARWWEPGAPPCVDIYIATYNEEKAVLERTLIGAKASDYPNVKVFVLDDGRRAWLGEMCEQLGIGYLTRADNAHAKAGNINAALRRRRAEPDAPDFVAVLDADFVPHRDFVAQALALFHDPTVGLVQTPQHFFNPDPIQHNLGISEGYPDEQRFFFDHVEPARDAWGIAVCCGTSSMVRTEALQAIGGGLPTDSVTEDFLLTLKLGEAGWRTVYLNQALTEGLAPEGMQEYIVQRGRWCLGMMEIVRKVYNPFGRHGLGLMARISVLDSLLYWTSTFSFRLAGITCPLLYWYVGITVVNARVEDVIAYYLPFYIATLIAQNWLSRGLILPLLNDVSQLVAAWPIMNAAFMGLATRGPHKFRVTAKGGDRTKVVVQWPLMKPFAILLAFTLGGLFVSFADPRFNYDQAAGDGMLVVLSWTLYNIVLLILAVLACIEWPREDRPQRAMIEAADLHMNGRLITGWLSELGLEIARVRGAIGLERGQTGTLSIAKVGDVAATIIAEAEDGYRLRLAPTPVQRQWLIIKLHTEAARPGIDRGSPTLMFYQLARKLTAR